MAIQKTIQLAIHANEGTPMMTLAETEYGYEIDGPNASHVVIQDRIEAESYVNQRCEAYYVDHGIYPTIEIY